jgi:RNA polymerase sigma-70 factor (ECF subfamily)
MVMQDADHSSVRETDGRPAGSTCLSLIDQAREGEQAAWQQLESVYRPLVLRWCRRFGVTRAQDVEDVTQEVFQTVFIRLIDFTRRETGSFRGWLKVITRFKVQEHYNRHRGQPQAEGGSDASARLHNLAAEPEEDSPAEEDSDHTLLVRSVLEVIRPAFQPKTWEAATRVLLQEQSLADVAADLGLSDTAIYTAKSRVLKRLREKLQELNESDGGPAPATTPR